MSISLVDKKNIDDYDKLFASGYDHMYPDLDLVRLERWYFKHEPGKILDYGFGTGENLIHFLRCGYTGEGIDGSKEAVRLVQRKLERYPEWRNRFQLQIIEPQAARIPYENNSFDYVVCVGVLSLLALRERIELLLREFMRVMKQGAKMVATTHGPGNLFFTQGHCVADDVYEFTGRQGDPTNITSGLHYIPKSESHVRQLFQPLIVDEVGMSSYRYGGVEDFRFIICARKP